MLYQVELLPPQTSIIARLRSRLWALGYGLTGLDLRLSLKIMRRPCLGKRNRRDGKIQPKFLVARIEAERREPRA